MPEQPDPNSYEGGINPERSVDAEVVTDQTKRDFKQAVLDIAAMAVDGKTTNYAGEDWKEFDLPDGRSVLVGTDMSFAQQNAVDGVPDRFQVTFGEYVPTAHGDNALVHTGYTYEEDTGKFLKEVDDDMSPEEAKKYHEAKRQELASRTPEEQARINATAGQRLAAIIQNTTEARNLTELAGAVTESEAQDLLTLLTELKGLTPKL